MRKILLGFIAVASVFSLMGCQQDTTPTNDVQTNTAHTKVDVLKVTTTAKPEVTDTQPYVRAIRAYMYFRTQAVVNNKIDLLWNKYPELKKGTDLKKGINTEKYEVESFNERYDVLDANFNIEDYEKIKIKTINDNEVIALVHGTITYLNKGFDEYGGEYLIKMFLKKQDGLWEVVKTDEFTLPEYKQWLKDKKW